MIERAGYERDVEVQLIDQDDGPRCPQCCQQGLLSALVPYAITNSRGESVPGRAVSVLCAGCDIDDPAAGPLIAFLAVHSVITQDVVLQAGQLIKRWLEVTTPKPVDAEALAAEYELWLQGEL